MAACNDYAGRPALPHILFIGFMGSGKSSVSRRMSAATGLSLIDVDQRIEALQHCKISDIFAAVGEEGFRKIETDTLRGLAGEPRSIISCGGGVVCNSANLPVMKELGCVIYLHATLEECLGHITNPSTRPLLNGERPVEDIYNERLAKYDAAADITIDTNGLNVYKVASLCIEALEQRGLL